MLEKFIVDYFPIILLIALIWQSQKYSFTPEKLEQKHKEILERIR